MIKVFLSHSGQDAALAELLVDLLKTALTLRANEIRCTSVEGYRLPAGADTAEQLREELLTSPAFIGLISPQSFWWWLLSIAPPAALLYYLSRA